MTQESLGKVKGVADIVFLLDVSGSMQPCLDALKENIGVFFDQMSNPGPNEGPVVKDWRVKICGYRDAKADGNHWWVEMPFTSDPAQVRTNLTSLEAKGGGDEPETMLDALWKLAKMPEAVKGESAEENAWRYHSSAARCVVVFTDATTQMATSIPEAAGAAFDDVATAIEGARLRLSIFCPEADCYQSIATIDKCEIELIGSLSDAREKMKEYTRDTSNFRKVMAQLAKSVSASADTPAL